MKISELIIKLAEIQEQHGDIVCVVRKGHEYWGSIDSELDEFSVNMDTRCRTKGPKSGLSEIGVVFDAE